jgi:hypothetical protein
MSSLFLRRFRSFILSLFPLFSFSYCLYSTSLTFGPPLLAAYYITNNKIMTTNTVQPSLFCTCWIAEKVIRSENVRWLPRPQTGLTLRYFFYSYPVPNSLLQLKLANISGKKCIHGAECKLCVDLKEHSIYTTGTDVICLHIVTWPANQ